MDHFVKAYYEVEKESRERRILAYTESIQEYLLSHSKEVISELVEERHNQNMTQQEISNITGVMPSNIARFEAGSRVPTLVMLQKYASALGKHIEIKICDNEEE